MAQTEPWVETAEIEKIIPFAAWSIHKMCRQKEIPHYRIKGKICFLESQIRSWAEAMKVEVEKKR
jgi:hypothetical protein|tara:strand:- start:147 stop:341 length:195 start_codon:yes stop_codon:yes gene_type:complete